MISKRLISRVSAALVALAVAASLAPRAFASPSATPVAPPFWTGKPDSGGFRSLADGELRTAKEALDRLVAVKGARTLENTLAPYNEALLHADNAAYAAGLIESVHPDSTVRGVAEEETRAASKFLSDLGLNREVYDALSKLDLKGADPKAKYMVEKTLRDFRLSGVDKDAATRKKIAALREELVQIGQDFDKNIRNDSRTITLNSAADLDGLPEDYIKAHAPGADGKISISIEYPDFFPVMSYAKNADVRQRLMKEFLNRAYPANIPVLDRLIAKRYELARMLGFKTWAEYATRDKMIENDKNVAAFIERLRGLTLKRATDEYAVYLKRKREDDPAATAVNQWDRRYYGELIRKRDYNFDAQQARPYFPFEKVKEGVLSSTAKMFGVTYKRIANADVWDPSVEAYEVWEDGAMIGRFYLDLHPRAGKFNHAANFGIRNGVEGIQIPEAALVCNFAGGKPDDPGLMEHGDVVTFFHEFGHLMHSIFGGHQPYEATSGISTEWDFVEAPSQMLEEWCWNAGVLQTFAKNQAGEPIPAEMVERMRQADWFGRATSIAYQNLYSAISLNYYNRPAKDVNTDAILRDLEPKYTPYPPMAETHFQSAFGHLDGYSAIYYTYMWSLVISKDMFSKFDKSNLLDPATAKRYRDTVLAQGGSAPAAKLVHNFLGRDYDYNAFDQWLAGEKTAGGKGAGTGASAPR
ncbi:MAG TPA: M3 family metallopeptidase [Candidatus Saccharimonadales bacterium]|nr:M3 family metallopeptidase [Candidatus Saccharimonadales bacterium]